MTDRRPTSSPGRSVSRHRRAHRLRPFCCCEPPPQHSPGPPRTELHSGHRQHPACTWMLNGHQLPTAVELSGRSCRATGAWPRPSPSSCRVVQVRQESTAQRRRSLERAPAGLCHGPRSPTAVPSEWRQSCSPRPPADRPISGSPRRKRGQLPKPNGSHRAFPVSGLSLRQPSTRAPAPKSTRRIRVRPHASAGT